MGNAQKIRENLDSCLLRTANTWFTEELGHLTQVGLQNDRNGVEQWCQLLEEHF